MKKNTLRLICLVLAGVMLLGVVAGVIMYFI